MVQSILVTGGTGFIGKYLLAQLSKRNLSIVAAIRDDTPLSVASVRINSIDERTYWLKSLRDINIVIHLAARAHVLNEHCFDPEAEFFRVNTAGTKNLVNQSLQADVKHFIFVSSIGAVAPSSTYPLNENTFCTPDTPYGHSKLAAEQALIQLTSNTPMNWTILRPPLVYGAGNPGNMERLCKLIKMGIPLPFAAINNQRSFLYVENLVDAIVTCITNAEAHNRLFHISDGEDLSTPDLIRKIAYYSRVPARLIPVPPPLLHAAACCGDILENLSGRSLPLNSDAIAKLTGSLCVDSSYIRNTLDWQPPFSVDEGLAKTFSNRPAV